MSDKHDSSWADWLDLTGTTALLDVGCNVGHLLQTVERLRPDLRLAGIEVSPDALALAKRALPHADLHGTGAEQMPFADGAFERVTCIEVLEHIPPALRRRALEEMHRVLKPGGALLLQVPHAGMFEWLDPGNFRFRFPKLYSRALRRGLRDDGMRERDEGVLWHHHFTLEELQELGGGLFRVERIHRGGLFLVPLADLARWPFYRLHVYDGRVFRWLGRAGEWDLGRDYGTWAYDIRLVLRRV